MLRIIAVFLLHAMALGALFSAEQEKEAEVSEKLVLLLRKVPPGLIPNSDSLPVSYRSEEKPSSPQYNATKFFEQCGVPFPKGAFAIYDRASSVVILRNTPKNLDLADICMGSDCHFGPYASANLEITSYEFTFAPPSIASFTGVPTFFELARLPKESIRVLDQVSVLANSGHPFELNRTTGVRSRKSSTSLKNPAGGFSTRVSGEITLGPNGDIFFTSISCQIQVSGPENYDLGCQFEARFSSVEDQPIVIYSTPLPGPGQRSMVIVARTRSVFFLWDGSPLPPLGDLLSPLSSVP